MDERTATRLAKQLAAHGFLALGGFHPGIDDAVPDARCGHPAATVILIGNAGSDLWNSYCASPEASDGAPHPLDRYTRRTLDGATQDAGLTAIYPFARPYHPFQRWAAKVGGFSQSPLGVLAHHRYGPWVAFRAAFISAARFGTFEAASRNGPCEGCVDKPCLTACPIDAVGLARYDVESCLAHLKKDPQVACYSGCLARAACPVGAEYRPPAAQAHLHMRAFAGAN